MYVINKLQKYLILIGLFITSISLFAQREPADTTKTKDCEQLIDLFWVADSVYKTFKTEQFKGFNTFYPSFKTYQKFTDTSAAGQQSYFTQYFMFNTFWGSLRIQHAKLMKKCKKAGIKWNKTEIDTCYADSGNTDGLQFAYLYWRIKYNKKKKYLIQAMALNIEKKWFIMDELKFLGLVREPKKKKPNKSR